MLNKYNVRFIGSDTNCGLLSTTVSIYELREKHTALVRRNTNIGNLIYVTEALRESAAGSFLLKKQLIIKNLRIQNYLVKKHINPVPRVFEGIALRKNF